MSFLEEPQTKTFRHTFALDPKRMPVMVGFIEPHGLGELLNQACIESDLMDGSMFDSDGVEKKMIVCVDYKKLTVSLQTLPEDYLFWKGTEQGQNLGQLGYYQNIFDEDVASLDGLEYVLQKNQGTFGEVFLWDNSHVEEYHPNLFEQFQKEVGIVNTSRLSLKGKICVTMDPSIIDDKDKSQALLHTLRHTQGVRVVDDQMINDGLLLMDVEGNVTLASFLDIEGVSQTRFVGKKNTSAPKMR